MGRDARRRVPVEPADVVVGEYIVPAFRVVDPSTPRNVKLDPNFVSRLPLR